MQQQEEYIVELRHITKRFPGIVANDDISLGIKKGEIFALLGENGAGKSTLMSILFGMYAPDEGELRIRGKVERITNPNYATKLSIGMVHQHFKLVPNYTIAENIILGIEPKTRLGGILPVVDIKGSNARIAALSARYGLDVDPTQKIEDVSVSTQQRVEILKMLYREAEILIFDEPTAVLTPQEITYLLKIIRSLRDDGKTIILITHKLEEIKEVADRCGILNRGRLVGMLDVASTSTREMASLMVGRDVDFTVEKSPAKFGDTVLAVQNLQVKNEYGRDILRDICFSIRAGEIFAVAGVEGNGQMELADALAGLLPSHGGTITLVGQDITKSPVRERTELGLSYIPQDRQEVGLVLDMNLSDNLALKSFHKPPYASGIFLHKDVFEQKAKEQIRDFDIRCARGSETEVRSMSGGNQQKAIIAREIALGAALMIFVQPTRGLDIGAIEHVHEQILAQRDAGHAVLLISLELDEVMALADTVGVIFGGQFVQIAAADSLTTEEVGQFMMGVKQT